MISLIWLRLYTYIKYDFVHQKEEARLDGQCAQLRSKKILFTKDIKANQLVAIMLNLIKVPLFCTEDGYFMCNLG